MAATDPAAFAQDVLDAAVAWHASKDAPKWTLLTTAITAQYTDAYYYRLTTGATTYEVISYTGETGAVTVLCSGCSESLADDIVTMLSA